MLFRSAIGVDSDQGLILATSDNEQEREIAEHIVSSMLKRVDQAVFNLSGQFIDNGGSVDGGYVTYALEDGGVGIAQNEFNDEVVGAYADQVAEVRDAVVSGEISVPDHDDQLAAWMEATF